MATWPSLFTKRVHGCTRVYRNSSLKKRTNRPVLKCSHIVQTTPTKMRSALFGYCTICRWCSYKWCTWELKQQIHKLADPCVLVAQALRGASATWGRMTRELLITMSELSLLRGWGGQWTCGNKECNGIKLTKTDPYNHCCIGAIIIRGGGWAWCYPILSTSHRLPHYHFYFHIAFQFRSDSFW